MLHKRKFGKRGYVAVLLPKEALRNAELMTRLDAAAVQFGITHDYAFDFLVSRHPVGSSYFYRDLADLASAAMLRNYCAILSVGPEATTVLKVVLLHMANGFYYPKKKLIASAEFFVQPMTIAVDGQEARDANAPYQFEMCNPRPEFSENLSNLVQTCLQKNISQEEGVDHIRSYEAARQTREWGLFDDCYVVVMNRNRVAVTVRFEDGDDEIVTPVPELPFMGRDRVILFQA